MNENSNVLYRLAESKHYDWPAHIFGLDYYDRDSRGEDDFTRKLIWFYVYGDNEIKEEFREQMGQLFDSVFNSDEEEWHLMTLYPTHKKGDLNVHLEELFQEIAEMNGIDYKQVFFRNRNIEENHEIDSVRKKVLNLEGSVDIVEDVKGKNIIVVDPITLSGTSMIHATEELYREGANNVACVCLGLGLDSRENDKIVDGSATASEIIRNNGKTLQNSS